MFNDVIPSGIPMEQISLICQEMILILSREPTLLALRAPIKIYGNLHGNLQELKRMFKSYGFPYEGDNGDIEKMNYLFLGDYVDRGQNSVIIKPIIG
jgi:protein phosphatase